MEIVGYITGSTTRQNQPGKLQKQHPSPSAALFVTFLQHSALLRAVLLLFTLETTQKTVQQLHSLHLIAQYLIMLAQYDYLVNRVK